MKILQIIDNLQLVGGAQKLQVLFAQALADRDIDLTVVSLQEDCESPITSILQELGVRVVFIPGKSLVDPARFWRLVSFLRSEDFDVVHTHLTFANILGGAAAGLTGTPLVASIHNERIQKRRYYAVKFRLETMILQDVARDVIAVGYSAAEAHRERLYKKQICVVPNAVEIPTLPGEEERNTLRRQLTGDSSFPILITVGRLVPQKGYDDLLTAFAKVNRRFPDARLLFAGDGHLREQLQEQIQKLGLEGRAQLLGVRTDVLRLLAASDLYVNSSLWEGLSKALLEAMAAGLPIVATRVGDAPRVVVEGSGRLVPPGEPDLLADALCDFLADRETLRAGGMKARQYAIRNHDPVVWAEKILSIYHRAVGEDSVQTESSLS